MRAEGDVDTVVHLGQNTRIYNLSAGHCWSYGFHVGITIERARCIGVRPEVL